MGLTLLVKLLKNFIGGPAWDCDAVDVTGGDATYTTKVPRAFRVGTTAGNVVVRPADGSADRTIPNVQVGETITLAVTAIRQTGTTAVGITVFY